MTPTCLVEPLRPNKHRPATASALNFARTGRWPLLLGCGFAADYVPLARMLSACIATSFVGATRAATVGIVVEAAGVATIGVSVLVLTLALLGRSTRWSCGGGRGAR